MLFIIYISIISIYINYYYKLFLINKWIFIIMANKIVKASYWTLTNNLCKKYYLNNVIKEKFYN